MHLRSFTPLLLGLCLAAVIAAPAQAASKGKALAEYIARISGNCARRYLPMTLHIHQSTINSDLVTKPVGAPFQYQVGPELPRGLLCRLDPLRLNVPR